MHETHRNNIYYLNKYLEIIEIISIIRNNIYYFYDET